MSCHFLANSLPAGYTYLRKGSVHLICAADFEKFQQALVEQDFDSLPSWKGREGRAPLRGLALCGRSEALVRSARRGGLFGHWLSTPGWKARGWDWRAKTFASPKRFLRELEASERLRAARIRTPRVLALKLKKSARGPLRRAMWEAWTVMEPVRGAESLRAHISSSGEQGRALMEQAAHFFWRMHEEGVVHADLHDGNLLVASEGIWVLDLDKARLCSQVGFLPRICNLLRFVRSLDKLRARGCALSSGLERHFLESYAERMGSAHFSAFLGDAYMFYGFIRPARLAWWRAIGAV